MSKATGPAYIASQMHFPSPQTQPKTPRRKTQNTPKGLTKKLWLQPQAEGRDQYANANGTGVASEARGWEANPGALMGVYYGFILMRSPKK